VENEAISLSTKKVIKIVKTVTHGGLKEHYCTSNGNFSFLLKKKVKSPYTQSPTIKAYPEDVYGSMQPVGTAKHHRHHLTC
jgi:hypothetical protein